MSAPQPTPSAGAVRAAHRIHSALIKAKALNGLDPNLTFDILSSMAEIIDRETGAGRLAEHLEILIDWGETMWSTRPDAEKFKQPNVALQSARAALAAWKEGQP